MAAKPEITGLLILTALVMIPPALTLLVACDWIKSKLVRTSRRRYLLRAALIADVILVLCAADAWLIEPRMLTVTRISAVSPKIASQTGNLKIVHISDVHFVRRTPLTERILRTIQDEKPDLLFVTGDIQQIGRYDRAQFRDFLSRLCAIAPSFGVTGYDDGPVLDRASGGKLRIMDNASSPAVIRGTEISLWGVRAGGSRSGRGFLSIALVHSPDDIAAAVESGADWCFAGHTHGGQVRLPFWGAIVTAACTGKRYEYGRYRIGRTEAFVTRGIGLEPRPAPQVRFLCPPEIVVLTLTNQNPGRE